jgi:hypothetical protein
MLKTQGLIVFKVITSKITNTVSKLIIILEINNCTIFIIRRINTKRTKEES